jgi:hypothetical protein
VLTLLAPGFAAAIEASAAYNEVPLSGFLTVSVSGLDEKSLREHILGGFRSRMQFRVRVYRESSRLLPLLGDDMLFEAHPEQTGRWDPFSSSYELRFHDGSRRYYSDWEAFFRGFTGLRDFPVPEFGDSRVYILV